MNSKEHKLIAVTAPSGAGKTTIVHHLLQVYQDQLAFSVSATTRPPRDHESHGVDYYFYSKDEFEKLVADEAFVEWEEVYQGRYYGTLRTEIYRLWALGKHVIFDIDVKGALNIKRSYPGETLTIFIHPPSLEALEERLRSRETETEAQIQVRMNRAQYELEMADQFDSAVLNDDLELAMIEVQDLVNQFLNSDSQ